MSPAEKPATFSVNLSQVCDGRSDCVDKSDELNCEVIRLDLSYLKSVPPPAPTMLDLDSNEKLKLFLNVTLESVLDINEVGSLIQVQLQVTLSWIDSRVDFVNLKSENGNVLPDSQKTMLWMPSLLFLNTKERITSFFGDNNSSAVIDVLKGSKGTKSPLESLKNERIHSGQEWYVFFFLRI